MESCPRSCGLEDWKKESKGLAVTDFSAQLEQQFGFTYE